jgi:hypothetical protein
MPETADLIRRAAVKMRHDVQRLLDEIDRRPAYWGESLGDTEAYRAGVEDGLGGPAGHYAAAWHPGVALAVADLLDAVVDEIVSTLEDHDDVIPFGRWPAAWTAALTLGRAYLGEADA